MSAAFEMSLLPGALQSNAVVADAIAPSFNGVVPSCSLAGGMAIVEVSLLTGTFFEACNVAARSRDNGVKREIREVLSASRCPSKLRLKFKLKDPSTWKAS
ncbi:hypothetical protein PRIC2_010927 [Phytophthora ramorum]